MDFALAPWGEMFFVVVDAAVHAKSALFTATSVSKALREYCAFFFFFNTPRQLVHSLHCRNLKDFSFQ